jgi:8-oxo-dGTP pyrophosphatase MutT (NUDIX family)
MFKTQGSNMATTPKFASAIILFKFISHSNTLGMNPCNFVLFMIQRSKAMKFLGGVHAFPGGRLEEDDCSEASFARCKGFDKSKAHELILDKKTYHTDVNYSLGFWLTGIREVFEEIGILFAYDQNLNLVDLSNPTQKAKFEVYRNELLQDKILFSEIIAQEDLFYAIDKLYYFTHFITPELSPIRYDTRFFLAEIPPNQSIHHNSSEIISTVWATPTKLLESYRTKEIKLIPPQYACLSKLQKIADIKAFCVELLLR